MINIAVVLTCFNRKHKTLECIDTIYNGNKNIKFKFFVVDDNSSDGTVDALSKLPYDIYIIHGSGNLYWNGGMYKGIAKLLESKLEYDYCLLINDDVKFFENSINKIVCEARENEKSVIVGATCDKNNQLTYGGIEFREKKSLKYRTVEPQSKTVCDTFNANCVLISYNILKKIGNLDPYYKHSMGDFDYGFRIREAGFKIFSSKEFVGNCEKNVIKGSWMDPELNGLNRIKAKENIKGLPFRQWFYYLNKNYGIGKACLFSLTPYIKIIFK